jgi:hypothetical protein
VRIVDISTVSIAIASAGVFIAAIYYILQIRHQIKLRQTDLIMRLYSTYGSPEFQEAEMKAYNMTYTDYDDYVSKYEPISEGKVAWNSHAAFFEGIGVLLHRQLIDMELVDDLFSTPVISTWEKIEPLVKARRERLKRPQIWEWFEYLYNEMQKREQKLRQSKA